MTGWDEVSATDRARIGRWQIVIVAMAVLAKLCLAGDWYGFAATLSFVSKDLGMSAGESGLAQGAIAITYGFGMFFWSPISRRFSGRWFLMIGLTVTGLAMLAQAFIHDMATLVALRLLIGFFEAGVWVGAIKLIFGWFPPAGRGLVMGIVLAAYSLAITIDFAAGVPVTIAFGWRVFFAGLGLFTLLVAALAGILGRSGPASLGIPGFAWETETVAIAAPKPKLSLLFKAKWLYIGGFGIFGDTFALAASATWVVPGYVQQQGMPEAMGAVIGTVMGLSQVAFLLLGGYLSDRMSRTHVIQIGAGLAALSALLFTAAMVWPMPPVLLVAISGLSGVAVFSGGAIFGLLGEKYPPELGPAASGYAEVFGMASTFAAPYLMGVTIDLTHSFFAAFMVFTVSELVVFGLILTLCRAGRPARVPLGAEAFGPAG
jgi:MFS family permease